MKKILILLGLILSFFGKAQTGSTIAGSMVIGGVTRTYTIYVPTIYSSSNPTPLVFNIHGLSGSSDKQEDYEDFRKIADTANFIIVHPQALGTPGILSANPTSWNVFSAVVSDGEADRNFIMALLDKIETEYTINNDRIYATGYSQGGYMSYNLGCLFSSRFAALAPISGSMAESYFAVCNPQHPTPIMEIHGTNDALVAYNGGAANTVATDTIVKYWVNFNNCNPTPISIDTLPNINIADSSRVVHFVYTGGDSASTVEFYKILNGGHQVPALVSTPSYGIGNRNMDFDAAKEIWRFFSKYDLKSLGGTGITSEITVEENAGKNISIYPNPSNGSFILNINDLQNSSFIIVDLLGKIIVETKVQQGVSLLNLNITPGVYFYEVSDENKVVKTGKLIIQ